MGNPSQIFVCAPDCGAELREREASVEDVIGQLGLPANRHLCANAAERFHAGEMIALLQSINLGLLVGRDDDDSIHAFMGACFDQERGIINHNRVRVLAQDLAGQPSLFTSNARMNDGVQPAKFGGVAEDDAGKRVAVQGLIRIEHFPSVFPYDVAPGRLPGLNDLPSQDIGIDDDGSAFLEQPCHCALAGCESACQSNQDHSGG